MNTSDRTVHPPTSSVPATLSPDPVLRLDAIHRAQQRVAGSIRLTPCLESVALGAELGLRLFLKRDDLQCTHSFKERGAANALACLPVTARRQGVVAASAGNHALGLAWHGPRRGVTVTLVMPQGASRIKVERCRALGARVVIEGDCFGAADAAARLLAQREGAHYVHPFDDFAVMAGQGTLGLEVLQQVPELDVVVVPVGGGGLLAGVATAIKGTRPAVRVIAAEPAAAASFAAACARGGPTAVVLRPTWADGLAVARVGRGNFTTAYPLVDDVVAVSEDAIAGAMLRLFEVERVIVEGAAAVALAALYSGRLTGLTGRTVVLPVSGANVDAEIFAQALRRAAGVPPD